MLTFCAVSTSIGEYCASPLHGVNQTLGVPVEDVPPLLDVSYTLLSSCSWSWLQSVEAPLQHVPEIFDWFQVSGVSWIRHERDVVLPKVKMCTLVVALFKKKAVYGYHPTKLYCFLK